MTDLNMPEGKTPAEQVKEGDEGKQEGLFSRRKDVVFKTLLRKVRKYA